MTKQNFKNDIQKWFKRLIWSAFYCLVFAAALVQGAEEAQGPLCTQCSKPAEVITSQNLENITNKQYALRPDSQAHCFDQLTDQDRTFLKQLFKKMSQECGIGEGAAKFPLLSPLKRSPASDNKVNLECATSAQSMMFKEIEDYGRSHGTAAKIRLTTAILAQIQRLQIINTLKDFADPAIASSFQQFTEAVRNYDQSLERVQYQDPNKKDSKGVLSWLYERGAMTTDWLLTKTPLRVKTQFRKHEKAAERLLFSGVSLNKKIQNANFSEEKKQRLIEQVQSINNLMRDRYNQTKNVFNEEAQMATLATGGFVSAVLIAASLGSYSPSLLWAGSAADFLSATLSTSAYSAIGATGVSGMVEVSKMILSAKVAAEDNASRFLCELAKKMNADGEKSIETILTTAMTASGMGAGIGGTVNLASRGSKVKEYGIFAGVLASFIGLNIKEVKNKLEVGEDIDGKKAYARLQYEKGEIQHGEYLDMISQFNQEEADLYAELMRHGINVLRLSYISDDVFKAIGKEQTTNTAILSAIKNLESQSGRAFTEAQQKVVMNVFALRIKAHKDGKSLKEHDPKVTQDLKSAGFTLQEIQNILNVNITTIILNSPRAYLQFDMLLICLSLS